MSYKTHLLKKIFFLTPFLVGLIFLVASSSVQAQTNFQAQLYSGIEQSHKKAFFEDNFDSRAKDWKLLASTTGILTIKNGFLHLKSETDALTSLTEVPINENEDFEIEIEIQFISGNERKAFGLQWGRSASEKRYFSFVINADGKYAISKFSGAYVNYVPPKDSKLVKNTELNKITIRKIDNSLYFFLNEELVHNMDFMHFYGNLLGFQTSGKNEIKINYLKVWKISNTTINKAPEIIITSPVLVNTFADVNDGSKRINITGRVKDESEIKTVTINQQEFPIDANGNFVATVELKETNKNVKISVKDDQLIQSEEVVNIKRSSTNNSENAEFSFDNFEFNEAYYALIIGVNDYENPNVPDLANPISDAKLMKQVLTENYTFNEQNVQLLENPTRHQLIIAFDELSNQIGSNDNLLIFYAGHGFWDFDKKLGFWLPADASISNSANWFRNTTLKSYISSIKTKNILLIADACFSGGIFKTRSFLGAAPVDIKQLYKLPSRKAMTSGNLKEVPDESIFIKFMTKRLLENQEKYITAEKLFNSFKDAVIGNTENEPQFGTIRNAGDEGGDFIFIRR